MKTILCCILVLLFCTGAFGQIISHTQLDSLKGAIKHPGEMQPRMNALYQVLGYYAMVPTVDSIIPYQAFISEHAPEISVYTQHVAKTMYNRALGTAYSLSGEYSTALTHYTIANQTMAAALQLELSLKERNSARQFAKTLLINTAIVYGKLGRYALADSVYQALILRAEEEHDTATLVISYMNSATFRKSMANIKANDSAAVAKALLQSSAAFREIALKLARDFLQHHPSDKSVRRYMIPLLVNQAQDILESPGANTERKTELLALILESVRTSREYGISNNDILLAKEKTVDLLRILGRFPKALETINDVIAETQSLGMPSAEASAIANRAEVYWDMKHYEEAMQDTQTAIDIRIQLKEYQTAMMLSEDAVIFIHDLSPLKRYKYRHQRAHFEALAQKYRQQAKEAGQEVPEAKP